MGEYGSNPFHRSGMIALAFLSRMFVYSGSAIVWIVTAETLTTDIRATGHSAANAVARIGAFSAPYVVSPETSISVIGVSMFCMSLFNVTCTWYLPETKGRPLGKSTTTTNEDERMLKEVPTAEEIMA
jgi:hypothetical protein